MGQGQSPCVCPSKYKNTNNNYNSVILVYFLEKTNKQKQNINCIDGFLILVEYSHQQLLYNSCRLLCNSSNLHFSLQTEHPELASHVESQFFTHSHSSIKSDNVGHNIILL